MKMNVDESLFIRQFVKYNRIDNFGIDGLRALFEYLTRFEQAIGEDITLDVIGLCCDYRQFDSIEECLSDYGLDSREQLEDQTVVIEYDGGIIIQGKHK